jgi:hypothetical protein
MPFETEADRVELFHDGSLLFFVGAECIAGFAPNGWLSFIKRQEPKEARNAA